MRFPQAVAVDASGNVYIATNGSCNGSLSNSLDSYPAVYKEAPQPDGSYVQTEIGTGLGDPVDVAVDGAGNVYVVNQADPDHYGFQGPGVYIETPSGSGYVQTALGSGWVMPSAVAVDGTGNVFVSETGDQIIYRVSSLNGVTTKTAASSPFQNEYIWSIALDGRRNLYVMANALQKASFGDPPALSFGKAAYDDPSSDTTQTVKVSNLGNQDLMFSALRYPVDFPEGTANSSSCTASTTLAPASSCALPIAFRPAEPLDNSASLNLQESLHVATNTLRSKESTQSIRLFGEEVRATATPVFSIPSGTVITSPRKLYITDSTPGAVIYWRNDGQIPTLPGGANRYTGPITIRGSWTVKAIAVAPGHVQSAMIGATYNYK